MTRGAVDDCLLEKKGLGKRTARKENEERKAAVRMAASKATAKTTKEKGKATFRGAVSGVMDEI